MRSSSRFLWRTPRSSGKSSGKSSLVLVGALAALGAAAACNKKEGKAAGGGAAPSAPSAQAIKIGQTLPYSGPASAYAVIGKVEKAYFDMLNEQGGIGGRKLELVSLDDSYSPAKTVELTRKLVESEGVLFLFNPLGTAHNTATQPYLEQKKVPQLFVATGAAKFTDPSHPLTMGWQPSYQVEASIYAKHVLADNPGAKVCVLYQNDDFGKDFLDGLKRGFAEQYDAKVVKTASYEVADPTVDSQLVSLQATGCDTLMLATTPKFGAQAIRKVFDLGWKPKRYVVNISVSINAVLTPAGLDKSTDIITATYLKDPSDPTLADDAGLKAYRDFMKARLPDVDAGDVTAVYAFGVSQTLAQVLTQCGADLSRENVMKQATNLKDFKVGVAVEGALVNTSPTDYAPFAQMQLARFNGKSFERFGDVMTVE